MASECTVASGDVRTLKPPAGSCPNGGTTFTGATGPILLTRSARVPDAVGDLWLYAGEVSTAAAGVPILEACELSVAAISVDQADSQRTYILRIMKGWTVVASVTLSPGDVFEVDDTISGSFSMGDELRAKLEQTAGPTGKSAFEDMVVRIALTPS